MGIAKLTSLEQTISAWLKTCGKSNILQTKPIKPAELKGVKYTPPLMSDCYTVGSCSAKSVLQEFNLNEYIKKELLIGQGGEGAVYRITGTDFVVKIPHQKLGKLGTSIDMSKLDFNVTPQEQINNIIAKSGKAEVLKYIPGFNTRDDLAQHEKEITKAINSLSPENIKQYFLYLSKGNKVGMRHDYAGANCIINPSSGKITPIDFCPGEDYRLLSSFMSQCRVTSLTASQENELLKKGVINLLELVKSKKIAPNEILCTKDTFCGDGWVGYKDSKFLDYVKSLCERFSKDSSTQNVDNIINELRRCSTETTIKYITPEQVKTYQTAINEISTALRSCTDPKQKVKLEISLKYLTEKLKLG